MMPSEILVPVDGSRIQAQVHRERGDDAPVLRFQARAGAVVGYRPPRRRDEDVVREVHDPHRLPLLFPKGTDAFPSTGGPSQVTRDDRFAHRRVRGTFATPRTDDAQTALPPDGAHRRVGTPLLEQALDQAVVQPLARVVQCRVGAVIPRVDVAVAFAFAVVVAGPPPPLRRSSISSPSRRAPRPTDRRPRISAHPACSTP